MAVNEVVRVMRDYIEEDGARLEQTYGPEAVLAAADMKELLAERLTEESAYGALWERFEADPEAVGVELVGALEAMIEADPALAKRLNEFIEAFHQVQAGDQARTFAPMPEKSPVGGGVPDTTYTSQDEEMVVEEGAYLYGDVPTSDVTSVGSGVGGQRNFWEMALEGATTDINLLFDRLQATVERHEDLDSTRRADLKEALKRILAEVLMAEGTVDIDALARHLRTVRRIDVDLYRLLLHHLSTLAEDLDPLVAEAVARMWGSED